MQFKALTLAALAGTALSQSLTDVLTNTPQLSNLTNYLSLFPDFTAQLASLSNITLLAPNNAAFATLLNSSAGAAITNMDQSAIQALFSYHVLNGTYSNFSEIAFVPTALMDPMYANVTGGQVVEAVPGDSGVAFYSGLLQNASAVGNAVNFTGGVVHIIDAVLTIPPNVSTTAIASNLTAAAGALTNASLISTVDGLADSTFFVPNNAAFQAIGSALANATTADLTNILTYHVISGTVAYSTTLMNGSIPTVQGTNVTISIIDGDVFVNSARVVVPNVLVANGVVHVIDAVLNPMNATATANPSASTGGVAFGGASSASNVPFTSGVPTPTASATVATSEAPGASSSSSGGAQPMKTGAVGAAALFGGAALVMNL